VPAAAHFRFHCRTAIQPTLRRPYSLSGAGCACIPYVPRTSRGDGAPRGASLHFHALRGVRASCDRRARLLALHRGICSGFLRISSGPRFLNRHSRRPMQQAPCRAVLMPPGRSPGAARVRGYEPRPRGPRLAPPSKRP
jgi:hypothetical protein